MNLSPESFTLQHSDVPQPKLLDIPVISDAPWPMPSTHPLPEEPLILGFDLGTNDHSALILVKGGTVIGLITTGEQPRRKHQRPLCRPPSPSRPTPQLSACASSSTARLRSTCVP